MCLYDSHVSGTPKRGSERDTREGKAIINEQIIQIKKKRERKNQGERGNKASLAGGRRRRRLWHSLSLLQHIHHFATLSFSFLSPPSLYKYSLPSHCPFALLLFANNTKLGFPDHESLRPRQQVFSSLIADYLLIFSQFRFNIHFSSSFLIW